MSPPSLLRFPQTWDWENGRDGALGSQRRPALSGNDSRRTTGKTLEVDDLVRGNGCWVFTRRLLKMGAGKGPDSGPDTPALH